MRLLVLAMCVALTCAIEAQAPPAASFNAASVKPASDRPAPPLVVLQAGGRLLAPRTTLKELVRVAYDVEPDQVIGGPSWFERDPFEIVAKAPATASRNDIRAMLQRCCRSASGSPCTGRRATWPCFCSSLRARPARNCGRRMARARR